MTPVVRCRRQVPPHAPQAGGRKFGVALFASFSNNLLIFRREITAQNDAVNVDGHQRLVIVCIGRCNFLELLGLLLI